jgi:uncharacterized damage-inducible protein DinB
MYNCGIILRKLLAMSEAARLADQIRRAFEGEAWHGDSVQEILAGVDAETAAAHPIPCAHSIWELVMHIRTWDDITIRRARGEKAIPTDEENFPQIRDSSDAAWQKAFSGMNGTHSELVRVVAEFPDSRLSDQVPGKTEPYYNFYYLFAGIVQHELYHAGQIVMLKKASR